MGVHCSFKAKTHCCMKHLWQRLCVRYLSMPLLGLLHLLLSVSHWEAKTETGGRRGRGKVNVCGGLCVYILECLCVKCFWNLFLKTGYMLLLVRHIITQKPPNDSGCLKPWRTVSLTNGFSQKTSTCVGSAWENQAEMLQGMSVLSPKCHVWGHRWGSLPSQTMWLRLTKCCLPQTWPDLSGVCITQLKMEICLISQQVFKV